MELWIRSQDKKNLVKIINQIGLNYLNNNMIIANYQPDFIGTQGEYYEKLGTYKSKERALEILDEISSKIKNQYIVETKGLIRPCDLKKKKENFEKMYNGDFIMQTPSFEIKPINPHVIYFEMPED